MILNRIIRPSHFYNNGIKRCYRFFRLGDSEGDRNIGEELANVQSLDLSETLIHDWNEIADIAGRLRRLESLVRSLEIFNLM